MDSKSEPPSCPFADLPRDFASLRDVDPYAFYDSRRNIAPLVWDQSARGWLVTSYEICRHVEMREDLFRHPYADRNPDDIEIKGGEAVSVSIGERHTVMHKFALGLFAPKEIAAYRQFHVLPVIDEMLSRFISKRRAELTSEFLDMIPPRVILSLLNIPWRNDQMVRKVIDLHDIIFEWASGLNPEVNVPRAKQASAEINRILLPPIRERRENPENDIISRIWKNWPTELGEATEVGALAVCRDLFMGGSDTTVHVLANVFHILLTQPEIMESVRADKRAIPNLVEEALRLHGAIQYRFRIANDDCELGGVKVSKDNVLVLINSAANRDPAFVKEPNDVNINRPRPREHLAFNKGPRTCIGAALARAEVCDVVEAVLDRTSNLRLDPDAIKPAFPGHFNRSFRPLNITFEPSQV